MPKRKPDRDVAYGFQTVAASEKKRLVQRHFDAIAGRYDLADALLSFGLHFAWKKQSVRALDLKSSDYLLDLCGGTADLALLAAPGVMPCGRVVVCDFNFAMMAEGVTKTRKARNRNTIVFVQGDAEGTPFPDNSFDAVIVGFGVRNLVHPVEGLREIHRILKKGGRFVCLEFSLPVNPVFRRLYEIYSTYLMPTLGGLITGVKDPYRYLHESIRVFPSPEEIIAQLTALGFQTTSFRRLTNGIAVIYSCQKAS